MVMRKKLSIIFLVLGYAFGIVGTIYVSGYWIMHPKLTQMEIGIKFWWIYFAMIWFIFISMNLEPDEQKIRKEDISNPDNFKEISDSIEKLTKNK